MKRSLQEVVELVVFGLIALLVGTGVLWLVGWLLGIVGIVFKFIAGIIWVLLRFIIPIAIVAGVIYFLVRWLGRPKQTASPAASTPAPAAVPHTSPSNTITVTETPKAAPETVPSPTPEVETTASAEPEPDTPEVNEPDTASSASEALDDDKDKPQS